jgi:hypothetical protein
MTRDLAARLVLWCIIADLLLIPLAIMVSPYLWLAFAVVMFVATELGTFHNTGRFYGFRRPKK